MIQFVVRGNPKGQPRPRAFAFKGKARVYDPGTAEGWKSLVAEAARAHLPEKPINFPVELRCAFIIQRPKSHFRTGKCAGELRSDAPFWNVSKPDLDNYEKAVWDCLVTVGMLEDDSYICRSSATKVYGTSPGMTLTIQRIR